LARRINDTISSLTNIDAILTETSGDLTEAKAVKDRADAAKIQAQGILTVAQQVLDSLAAAQAAQDRAQLAIDTAEKVSHIRIKRRFYLLSFVIFFCPRLPGHFYYLDFFRPIGSLIFFFNPFRNFKMLEHESDLAVNINSQIPSHFATLNVTPPTTTFLTRFCFYVCRTLARPSCT